MKNILLVFIIINIFFISCGYNKKLNCSDCSNREAVLKAVNQLAKKKLDSKIEEYQIKIEGDQFFYLITYTDTEVLMGLKLGGGIYFKISKKDCIIIDYRKFK